MKLHYLLPLALVGACSSAHHPSIALLPEQPSAMTGTSNVRYPEHVKLYHFGRYIDPNDDLVMHEQHVVYRVEENTRWNLHPNTTTDFPFSSPPTADSAFSPAPVNDAILAEVNSQRLATAQIMVESKVLMGALQHLQTALQDTRKDEQNFAALRAAISDMQKRLSALESIRSQSLVNTNDPVDSLSP